MTPVALHIAQEWIHLKYISKGSSYEVLPKPFTTSHSQYISLELFMWLRNGAQFSEYEI